MARFDVAQEGGVGAGGVDNFDGDGGLRENRRFGTAPGSNSGSGTKETPAVEMSAGHDAILSGWETCVYRLAQEAGAKGVLKRYIVPGNSVLCC